MHAFPTFSVFAYRSLSRRGGANGPEGGHPQSEGGRITGLGGCSFGFLLAEDVIADIREGQDKYSVRERPFETEVKAVEKRDRLRLISTKEVLSRNNLWNLPGC